MRNITPLRLIYLTGHTHQPIEAVFAFLSNHENYQNWYPGVDSVTSLDDAAHGSVGKAYLETLKMPGGRLQDIRIVTVFSEPPHRFMTQGDFAPLLPQMTFELKPASDGGTDMTWMFHTRHTSPVRRMVARLVFSPILRRQAIQAMTNLTGLLDRQPD